MTRNTKLVIATEGYRALLAAMTIDQLWDEAIGRLLHWGVAETHDQARAIVRVSIASDPVRGEPTSIKFLRDRTTNG